MTETETPKARAEVVVGPDMMTDLWEIVRSNRAAGRPSMARLVVNKEGGVEKVIEIRIPKREEQLTP